MDQVNELKVFNALDCVTLAATANGIVVDTKGYESLTFVINAGVITAADSTNYMTFKIQSGAESNLSDAADIESDEYLDPQNEAGTTWDLVLNATTEGEMAYKVGVIPTADRYYRIVATETLTFSGHIGVQAILGHGRVKPSQA